MRRAGVLLNDEEHVRWTLAELADWINEAVRAIILAKPAASSHSTILKLAKGTLQAVPTAGVPVPLALIAITRNLKSDAEPRIGGRVIRRTAQNLLDVQDPYWHDADRTRFQKEARNWIFDDANPLEFYVYPGNDGTGVVEAVVSTVPPPIEPSGEPSAIESWAGDIGLPEPYSVPILDYVAYRAQSKDDDTGNGGRAAAHYQQFATALGLKIQVDRAYSPNARPT